MDELDRNLLAAWHAVVARCEADPAEALRRWRRAQRVQTRRPPRAWCLAVRASDTRLAEVGWVDDEMAEAERRAHRIGLSAGDLVRLCEPVSIPWPGVRASEAAGLLGRLHKTVMQWAGLGVLGLRYESAPQRGCGRGGPVPYVWTRGPVDVCAKLGRPPDWVCGTLWQGLAERLPASFGVELDRVPRRGRAATFGSCVGWDWRCPGRWCERASAKVECGGAVRTLYAPLPVWTVGRALGERTPALRVPGVAEPWRPGTDDPLAGRRSLACARCWRVQMGRLDVPDGWNQFVTALSGGVLFGREVARPE